MNTVKPLRKKARFQQQLKRTKTPKRVQSGSALSFRPLKNRRKECTLSIHFVSLENCDVSCCTPYVSLKFMIYTREMTSTPNFYLRESPPHPPRHPLRADCTTVDPGLKERTKGRSGGRALCNTKRMLLSYLFFESSQLLFKNLVKFRFRKSYFFH